MILETARVTVKVEDVDVCVNMEEAEEVEKPSTSRLDSLLYGDDADCGDTNTNSVHFEDI